MTKVMRALRMLALATLLACLTAVPALAKDYTYTVRVFGGNKGSVQGKKTYVVSDEYAYGQSCTLSRDWVKVNDDKYYVKGFRISGRDEMCKETFKVTEDTDIVVAYGVKGNMVEYTISFVEYGTGNPLKDDGGNSSLTLKGNVGDKPVVAAAYVPGYRPLYENITGTLKEGENSWTIEYVKLETPETRTTTTTTTTGPTTTRPTTTTTTVTNQGTTVENGTTNATTENAGTAEGTADEGTEGEGTEAEATETEATTETEEIEAEETALAAPETQEILDMDNPLAGPGSTADEDNAHESTVPKSGLAALLTNRWAIIGGAAVLAAALVAAIVMVKRKRS